MKQYALALIASVASMSTYAQNLVPNPSFEEYSQCPFAPGVFNTHVEGWETWQETPDFFHTCSNDLGGLAGVPENEWGYQWPITGDGYAAVYTYVEFFENGREYVATQLLEPLTIGNQYYMMFFSSMYDGASKELRWCANSNIGLRFFKDPDYQPFPPDPNPLEPDNFAHLNYSEILDDYTNWTLIEGWFTADDDYNWVAIGNFFTDDQTEITILNDEGACSGIYYIENVCVASSPEECDYLLSADANKTAIKANVYPNPATESVRFSLPEKDEYTVVFFDAQGRMISNFENIRTGKEINVSTFQKGVYVVRVYNNHFFTTLKLIIK